MRYRIFTASTVQEAVSQVKETLGRDAVILYTKKLRKGWIFGREIVEVAAVADDDAPAVTASGNLRQSPANHREPARPLNKPAVKSAGQPRESVVKPLGRAMAKPAPLVEDTPAAASRAVRTEPAASAGAIYAEMKKAIEPLAPERIATGAAAAKPGQVAVAGATVKNAEINVAKGANSLSVPKTEVAGTAGEDLKSELTGIRQMLEQLLSKTKTTPVNPWYDYLVKKEITPGFAEQILKGFPYSLTAFNKNPEAIKKMLHDRLVDYIRTTNGIKISASGCKKVALVGPTGVGKTTTLAKLAAKFALEDNIDTAFISSDTYRIAAVEQLK
ncbi:MAG: hypothetical protein LBP78_06960, partial [Acidaminococcales bacterium]|nr:hypothetical protein [Acidaminococcales bacterium]